MDFISFLVCDINKDAAGRYCVKVCTAFMLKLSLNVVIIFIIALILSSVQFFENEQILCTKDTVLTFSEEFLLEGVQMNWPIL